MNSSRTRLPLAFLASLLMVLAACVQQEAPPLAPTPTVPDIGPPIFLVAGDPVSTDQDNYLIGASVTITGSPFTAGFYDVAVVRPDGEVLTHDTEGAVVAGWDTVEVAEDGVLTFVYDLVDIEGTYDVRVYPEAWEGDLNQDPVAGTPFDSADFVTNEDDYSPGETVYITVAGFQVGGSVEFQAQHVTAPGPDGKYGTPDDELGDNTGAGHDPWSVIDGSAEDLSSAPGTVGTTWFVDPDDSLGATFLLSASGLDPEGASRVATTSFTDAPGITHNQCQPGPNTGTNGIGSNCITNSNPNGWKSGLNSGPFNQGDSIPYRALMTDTVIGATYTLVIEYDITKGSQHAIDYLTTFNRTMTNADACTRATPVNGPGGTTAICADVHTFPIPIDPQVKAGLDGIIGNADDITQVPGVFTLYGGTITSVTYSGGTVTGSGTPGSPYVYAGTDTRRVTVVYTADLASTNKLGPVLTWSGHIARSAEWTNANPSGSPYHMRFVSWSCTSGGCSTGQQDLALNSAAVRETDLSITKTDDVDPVTQGGTLTYTVTVTNNGPNNAVNVVVTDTLPAGVTYVSSTGGCVEGPTDTLTCSLGDLPATAGSNTINFDIVVTVDGSTVGTITNTAEVGADTLESNPANNTATEDTLINDDHDAGTLSVVKSGDATTTHGEFETFTIDVTYTPGADGSAGVITSVVDDTYGTATPVLNAGFNVGDTDQDNLIDGTETWQYTVSGTIAAHVDGETDPIVNEVTVSGTDLDGDALDDATDTHSQDILHDVGTLNVVKSGDATTTHGESETFTIDVTYTPGADGSAGVITSVVDDTYGAATAVLSAGFNVGDTDTDNLIDAGETWQYTVSGTIAAHVSGETDPIVNEVTVRGTDLDGDALVDATDTHSQDILHDAGTLAVVKSGDATTTHGESETFTIDVTYTPGADGSAGVITSVIDDTYGAATPVLAAGFNAGDSNTDGFIDAGETWQYTVSGTIAAHVSGETDPIINEVTVSGTDLDGDALTDAKDTHSQDIEHDAGTLTVVKSGDATTTHGEFETFTIDVTYTPGADGSAGVITSVIDDVYGSAAPVETVPGTNDGDSNTDGFIDAGETWQYTVSGTIAAHVSGETNPIVNEVTVSGTDLDGDALANVSDTHSQDIKHDAGTLTVVKSGDATTTHGEFETFTIDVTYTPGADGSAGVITSVIDDTYGAATAVLSAGFNAGDSNTDGFIDAGETWQYTVSGTIAAHVDGETDPIVNEVTVSGTDQDGDALVDASDTHSQDVLHDGGTLTVVKSGDATTTHGESETFTIDVTYTPGADGSAGVITSVVDDTYGAATPVLAAGFNTGDTDQDGLIDGTETWQYTVSGTIAAHVDGETYPIINEVTVTGTDQDGDALVDATDTHSQDVLHEAGTLTVIKTGDATALHGDNVTYDISVTYSSPDNSPAQNVVVTDDHYTVAPVDTEPDGFNDGDTDQDGLLDVTETWLYTASGTIPAHDDVEEDPIVNTAAANGEDLDGDAVTPGEDDHSTNILHDAGTLNVVKSGDATTTHGEFETFTIDVTYTPGADGSAGVITTVVDDIYGAASPVLAAGFNAGDTDTDNLIDSGETWQYTVSGTIAAHVDGETDPIINEVTVSGEDQDGDALVDASDTHSQDIKHDAGTLNVVKSGDATTTHGESETFTIDVTYTPGADGSAGVITSVVDDTYGIATPVETVVGVNDGDTDGDGFIDSGETWQYTVSGTIAAHVDGETDPIVNEVTVSGTDQDGDALVDASDTHSQDVLHDGGTLTVVKSGDATTTHGESETFTIDVTYTPGADGSAGVITSVVDDVYGTATPVETVPGTNDGDTDGDGFIDSGETWQYTVSGTIAAHVDGETDPIVNEVTVSGTDQDNDALIDATDDHSQDVLHDAGTLTVVKGGDATTTHGEFETFTIDVTYTPGADGSAGVITSVVDDTYGAATAVLNAGFNAGDTDQDNLIDGTETWQYTVSGTIAAHVDGETDPIVNEVTVSGTDQDGDALANATDTHSQDIKHDAGTLTVVKGGDATTTHGESETFTIDVTYTPGADGSAGVITSVIDDIYGIATPVETVPGTNDGDTDGDGLIDSGETWQYTVSGTIAAHVDDETEPIVNEATVSGTDIDGDALADASDTHSQDVLHDAGTLTIIKGIDADGNGNVDDPVTAAHGSTVTYVLEVTYSSSDNSPAIDVQVSDPTLGLVFTSLELVSGDADSDDRLDVTETWRFEVSYTVPAHDGAEDDPFVNSASVSGTDLDGDPVTGDLDSATLDIAHPSVGIVKEFDPTTVTAGDALGGAFTLLVTNNGDVALGDVLVGDSVDPRLQVTGVSVTAPSLAGAEDCSASSGQSVACTIPVLAVAESVTITVTFEVASSEPEATVSNLGTASSDYTDDTNETITVDDTATDSVDVIRSADVSIVKIDDGTSAVAGEQYEYTLTVHNAGPSDATGIVVMDTLPASMSFVLASDPSCEALSQVITCDAFDIAAGGADVVITITVDVASSVAEGTVLVNAASANGNETDPDPDNNEDTEPTDVVTSSDLRISKDDGVTQVTAGDGVTYSYTITVDNDGPSDADNVIVSEDSFPSGFTMGTVSSSQGACAAFTCNLGTIAAGGSATITVEYTVPSSTQAGFETNTVSVTSDEPDPDPSDNSADDTNEVLTSADLALDKSDDNSDAVAGTDYTYTIDVTNNGPSDSSGSSVSDTLPAGWDFVSSSNASCVGDALDPETVTCSVGALLDGTNTSFSITAAVPADAAAGTVDNVADVTGNETDPDPTNDDDTEPTNVVQEADLALDKSDDNSNAVAGTDYTYTIDVTNNGPSDSSGSSVSDTLPAGWDFVSSSNASCVGDGLDPESVTCPVGALIDGASTSFTITASVPADAAAGTVDNVADVTGNETDPDPTNDDDTEPTDVIQEADLALDKSDDNSDAVAGTNYTYTVEVTNNGPSDSSGSSVSDTLPAGWDSVSSSNASCLGDGLDPETVTCSVGALLDGANTSFTITAAVPADAPVGGVNNVADVTGNETDPNPDNDDDTEPTNVVRSADVSIVKSDDGSNAVAGEQYAYTLTVGNAGPSDATNIVVTDTLPVGMTFSSATGATCLAAGQVVTCDPFDIAAGGADVVITITVDVAAGVAAGAELLNTATANGTEPDPDPTNNEDDEPTTVDRSADLRITKDDGVTQVTAGDGVTYSYTITVDNDGPSDADNVIVSEDSFPAGFTMGTVSSSQGACAAFPCNLGTIAAGGSATITVEYTVPSSTQAGFETNTVSVTSDEPDPDPSDNSDTDTNEVLTSADVSVVKTDNGQDAVAGEQYSYALTVSNGGPSDATGIVVTDTLPTGMSFVSASGATCSAIGQNVTCNAFDIAAGGTDVVITVTVDVASSVANGDTLTNTATANGNETDPDPTNNEDDEPTDVVRKAGLSITKDDGVTQVTAGDGVTYQYVITLNNDGPSDADNVTVSEDSFPAGFDMGTVASSQGACAAFPCNLGTIAAGGSATITVEYTVPSSTQAGFETNTVSVTSDEPDPDPSDNSDTDTNEVLTSADVSVVKTDSGQDAVAGEQYSYTLTISNDGPSDATGIVVTDTVPAGMTFVSASGATCSAISQDVTCVAFDIAAGGADVVIIITVDVASSVADGTTLTNTAMADGNESDPDPTNNTDAEPTDVVREADVSIVKTDDGSNAIAGEQYEYTLTVSNAGPSDATGIVVEDTLPAGMTFVSASGAICSAVGQVVTCDAFDIAAGGAAVVITITVDVASSVADDTELINTVTADGNEADPDPENNTDTEPTVVDRSADVSIDKTDFDATATAGETFTYRLTVSNNGPSDATGIDVVDTLPAGMSFVSADDATCVATAAGFDCGPYDIVNSGADVVISITVDVASSVADGTTLTNTATANGNETDLNPTNNEDDEPTTVVRSADLRITKDDTVTVVTAGDGVTYTYTIMVDNNGPSDADNLIVTEDTFPAGFDMGTVTPSQGVCTAFPCNLGTIAAGGSATITVEYTVPSSTQAGFETNTVSVTGDEPDPDPSNNSADDTNEVLIEINLRIDKEFSTVGVIQDSMDNTFTIDVFNDGPSDALGVNVTDSVDPLLLVTAVEPQPECAASFDQNVDCTFDIPAGSSATVTVTFDVAVALPLTAQYGTEDGAEFRIIFVDGRVLEGSAPGPVYLDGVEIDAPGSGTKNDYFFDEGGFELHLSCSDEFTGGWGDRGGPDEFDNPAWQIASFSIVRYKKGAVHKECGEVTVPFSVYNTAYAQSDHTDPVSDDASIEIIDLASFIDPSLTITKTADLASATAGDTISYTIEVDYDTGSGQWWATDIVLQDNLCDTPLTFQGGDSDFDNRLDANETWSYECTYTVTGNEAPPIAVMPSTPSDGVNYEFVFYNSVTGAFITATGHSEKNRAYIEAIDSDVHVSCSDDFPGGIGENDGPNGDPWLVASYQIVKDKGSPCGAELMSLPNAVFNTATATASANPFVLEAAATAVVPLD